MQTSKMSKSKMSQKID